VTGEYDDLVLRDGGEDFDLVIGRFRVVQITWIDDFSLERISFGEE